MKNYPVTSRLSINAGIRYSLETMIVSQDRDVDLCQVVWKTVCNPCKSLFFVASMLSKVKTSNDNDDDQCRRKISRNNVADNIRLTKKIHLSSCFFFFNPDMGNPLFLRICPIVRMEEENIDPCILSDYNILK